MKLSLALACLCAALVRPLPAQEPVKPVAPGSDPATTTEKAKRKSEPVTVTVTGDDDAIVSKKDIEKMVKDAMKGLKDLNIKDKVEEAFDDFTVTVPDEKALEEEVENALEDENAFKGMITGGDDLKEEIEKAIKEALKDLPNLDEILKKVEAALENCKGLEGKLNDFRVFRTKPLIKRGLIGEKLWSDRTEGADKKALTLRKLENEVLDGSKLKVYVSGEAKTEKDGDGHKKKVVVEKDGEGSPKISVWVDGKKLESHELNLKDLGDLKVETKDGATVFSLGGGDKEHVWTFKSDEKSEKAEKAEKNPYRFEFTPREKREEKTERSEELRRLEREVERLRKRLEELRREAK